MILNPFLKIWHGDSYKLYFYKKECKRNNFGYVLRVALEAAMLHPFIVKQSHFTMQPQCYLKLYKFHLQIK